MLNLKNFGYSKHPTYVSLCDFKYTRLNRTTHDFSFVKILYVECISCMNCLEKRHSCSLMHRKRPGHAIGGRLNHACSKCEEKRNELLCFYAHHARNGTHS